MNTSIVTSREGEKGRALKAGIYAVEMMATAMTMKNAGKNRGIERCLNMERTMQRRHGGLTIGLKKIYRCHHERRHGWVSK